MNENLVTSESIEDLLKSIPENNHDVIRKLVDGLFISESFMEPVEDYENVTKYYSRNFFNVMVRRRGEEVVYPDIHENSISIPVLRVLQWIKTDLTMSDSYDKFKRKWYFDNARRVSNYDELKKVKDQEFERAYAYLQERTTKLKKMFNQNEVEALLALTEEF
jgi:hypothetical protein